MLRIDGKRLFDQLLRTTFEVSLLGRSHHVGPVGQNVGIIGHETVDLFKGLRALGPVLYCGARTGEHHPAVGIVRMLLQAFFEEPYLFGQFGITVLTGHLLHLFLLTRKVRIHGNRRADLQVEQERSHRNEHHQSKSGINALLALLHRHGIFRVLGLFQHASLNFGTRFLVFVVAHATGLVVGLKLFVLLAQNGQIIGLATRQAIVVILLDERPNHESQRNNDERNGNSDKNRQHLLLSARYLSPRSSASARRFSSGVNARSVLATWLLRRRRLM